MGKRINEVFERQLNGEFDDIDESLPKFADMPESKSSNPLVIDGEVVSQ